jgi:hypothetical protein
MQLSCICASRTFFAHFLNESGNSKLRSHIQKWTENPLTPLNHTPLFRAHLLKDVPRKICARLQRIYLGNLSVGHYHRHAHPESAACHFCSLFPGTPRQPETLTHLFATCKFACKLWKNIKHFIWSRALPALPFPTHPFTLTTGDASSNTSIPKLHFWHYLHAFTISRLYIHRCNVVFSRNANPSHRTIIAEIIGAVKSDIADCIAAAWVRLQAATSEKGFIKFSKLWLDNYGDHFATTSIIEQIDILTGEQGSRHNHRTITIHKL